MATIERVAIDRKVMLCKQAGAGGNLIIRKHSRSRKDSR